MRLVRLMAAAAFLLLLTGCLPVTSTSPVGTTAGLAVDPALPGTWKLIETPQSTEPVPPVYIHFLIAKDGTASAMYVATGGKEDEWMAFDIHTAVLGGNHFLNALSTAISGTDENGLKGRNIPFLYLLKGNTLTLLWMDEDKAAEAIKAGRLKGTVVEDKFGDVTITAEPAELDAFMAKPEAAEMFKAIMVLRKVN